MESNPRTMTLALNRLISNCSLWRSGESNDGARRRRPLPASVGRETPAERGASRFVPSARARARMRAQGSSEVEGLIENEVSPAEAIVIVWRPLVVPKPVTEARGEAASPGAPDSCGPPPPRDTTGSRYRPWAELLKRTFGNDVETCARCGGRMRLLALITDPPNVAGTSRARTDGILLGATGERCRASPEASRECRIPERSCGGPER